MTDAERYLQRLCERSFLRLWSYPGVYRDQGTASGREGKEVCDLLVVFENHVIVFSDKDCAYPESGDELRDWSRWFRKAVIKGGQSTWGAERWIREHPERLYLDRACTQSFPIALPDAQNIVIHRIVVAHGASARCQRYFKGGSGSLIIAPQVVGEAHDGANAKPFVVGQLDSHRGYVHVLDDTSVDILLNELTTISDFVAYLDRKEALIQSGKLAMATGEEELLAIYQRTSNADGLHDFVLPPDVNGMFVEEGLWQEYLRSPERAARQRADEISYLWDLLLDQFVKHLLDATQYFATGSVREQEVVFRFMARESRTRRRMLSSALHELMEKTPRDRRAARVIAPSHPGDPHYVFLLYPRPQGVDDSVYRDHRGRALYSYLMAAKVSLAADATDIVGIATESGLGVELRSEDMMYLDASDWTADSQREAEEIREKLQIFKDVKQFAALVHEFPAPSRSARRPVPMKGTQRNDPCPCGSGKKFKKCHGANR